jgi:hypothetical protein
VEAELEAQEQLSVVTNLTTHLQVVQVVAEQEHQTVQLQTEQQEQLIQVVVEVVVMHKILLAVEVAVVLV